MAYVNAGHIPGFIFGASGEVLSVLKRTGIPLGLRPETHYRESAEIELSPGQIILLLTDGFEEASNEEDEMFGTERIFKIVQDNRSKSAQEIFAALCDACRKFGGEAAQLDDLTATVIKVK